MAPRILVLSAPPSAGKDTVAKRLLDCLGSKRFDYIKPARPYKQVTHTMYGMPMVGPDFFDPVKDSIRREFYHQTPRQAYIKMIEEKIKPQFGNDIVIKPVVARIEKVMSEADTPEVIAVDGSTHEEFSYLCTPELKPLIEVITITRPGKTFAFDSRELLINTGQPTQRLSNGSLHSLNDQIDDLLYDYGILKNRTHNNANDDNYQYTQAVGY